jgi:putative hemolysin/membrane-bound inhibitor of C-type lysozyme
MQVSRHLALSMPEISHPASPAHATWSRLAIVLLVTAVVAVGSSARAQAPPDSAHGAGLANPASQNCVDKGGFVSLEKNGKGDQFGVCTFPDTRQCEEWAMARGDCRTGGVKVTGYVTPAARYCAITGGTYKVISGTNTALEQGTCTLKGGKSCRSSAYFNGACGQSKARPGTPPSAADAKGIQASFACDGGKTVSAVFTNGSRSSVRLTFSDGRELSLPQALSASGARYANGDESIVFWNTGNKAFIAENGVTTYSACTTRR